MSRRDMILVERVTNGERCGEGCRAWAMNHYEESCCILQDKRADGLECDDRGDDIRCKECLATPSTDDHAALRARVEKLEKVNTGLESALAGEKAAREHDRSVRFALPALLVAGCPDDIRALGWAVAVHNDYKLNGVKHTFWLFTKGGMNMKGEGLTDADALNEVRAALAACEEVGRG